MDFQLSDDQRALRAGVRELLAGRFGRDRMRAALDDGTGIDRALWRELGEAGFFALRLPETEGGVGLGLPESVLLFEEAGRSLLPGPLIATHLAAGAVKGAAEGETVVAVLDAGQPVGHLGDADGLLVLGPGEARTPGPGPEPGEARVVTGGALRDVVREAVPVRSLDPFTSLWRVTGPVGPGELLAGGARLRDEGALLAAAEQLGSAARTTEMAVQHAGEREQFGSPIGSFQAVKHLCAGMLVRAELARSAVYAAAVTADRAEIAGAKLLADDAAVRNARDCLQVHGGMGFTWEADVHLHLKRAWLRSGQWLTAAAAEEALAADLC
ncbi:acyl-CoA dehydrogenase family protein [Streptomyces sp. Ncost-T10-10d]|uniref:acyl-CoA dehydrogenase family protein n=1 Tax=Streptomyces sp. Ncost-T10-10d TaxID=1839774 RepID=UPI00081D9EC1|nr:acyl-CoA dehydrogenase family protein [Streptomyces sp. Ncost-T10-10d]SCF95002.1 Acyl-CoA dehydrogenase, N-terminal domain [Streptomyces sp. Ncost-T10-10d]